MSPNAGFNELAGQGGLGFGWALPFPPHPAQKKIFYNCCVGIFPCVRHSSPHTTCMTRGNNRFRRGLLGGTTDQGSMYWLFPSAACSRFAGNVRDKKTTMSSSTTLSRDDTGQFEAIKDHWRKKFPIRNSTNNQASPAFVFFALVICRSDSARVKSLFVSALSGTPPRGTPPASPPTAKKGMTTTSSAATV